MRIKRTFAMAGMLALSLALLPGIAAAEDNDDDEKVWVCKLVGKDGSYQKSPIHVSADTVDEDGIFRDSQGSPQGVVVEDGDIDCEAEFGDGDGGDNGDNGDDDNGDNGDNGGTGGGGGGGTTDDDEGVLADEVLRLEGETRIQTAIAVSQHTHDEADVVFLARSDLYPDALTGGPLAAALDAPILLTPSDSLHDDTAEELDRLGAESVYLLGETGALNADVESAVADLDEVSTVERIGGSDRFETAGLIARELVDSTDDDSVSTAYITEGINSDPMRGWPDAVAVSGLAAFEARPILLTATDEVPESTLTALDDIGAEDTVVIGGTAAVGADATSALEDHGVGVEQVGGDTRYHTSAMVADLSVEAGMGRSPLWLATGQNWPDALVAGPAVAAESAVLVLVHGDDLDNSPVIRDWIDENAEALRDEDDAAGYQVRLVGGPAAISDVVAGQLQ